MVVRSNLVAVPLNLLCYCLSRKTSGKFNASLLKTPIGEIFVQKPKSTIPEKKPFESVLSLPSGKDQQNLYRMIFH